MGATFLYGIGAAKSGTTWLSKAFRAHPQVVLPPIKETHYFDSVERGNPLWAMDQIIRVRDDARKNMLAAKTDHARRKTARRVGEIDRWLGLIGSHRRDDAAYEALLQRPVGDGHKVVADITPAYALLNAESFGRMAALNGGNTKFLMILRDPVDRLWSNISMTLTRRSEKGVEINTQRAMLIDNALTEGAESPEFARSDYAGTLSRLAEAVPAAQCLILFFEELFEADTLKSLADFLGLDTPPTGPEKKVNASTTTALAASERAKLATRLRPQYEAVKARLGRLPQRWEDSLEAGMVTS